MSVFDWVKRIFLRAHAAAAATHDNAASAPSSLTPAERAAAVEGPVWCVAANVVLERGYGPGGAERRRGTKHFAPGAKVFVYEFFWGVGGEYVTVIGRHRKSHRYIRLRMPAQHLANWRAELVYSPYVARQVRTSGEFAAFPAGSEAARRRAEAIVAGYVEEGAAFQPFVTRPPGGGDPSDPTRSPGGG